MGLSLSIKGKYGVICKTDALIRQISFGTSVYLINYFLCICFVHLTKYAAPKCTNRKLTQQWNLVGKYNSPNVAFQLFNYS